MKPGSIYPGWQVLAGSFVCAALAVGFSSYIFGMFTVPVTEEFGISRATYNNGMIGLMLGNVIASPLLGRLLDRISARVIFTVSALIFGLSMITISRTESLGLMLFLLTIPLSFATSGCGVLAANTVVVRWFQRRRGRALGVVALSTSVGGFLSQPLTAFLIETFGWRDALLLIGIVPMAILLLTIALAVRSRPSDNLPGYQEEFQTELAGDTTEGAAGFQFERTWSPKELLRNRNFWLVAGGVGILFGIDQAVLVSQVPYFQDIGYDLQVVGLLVAVKTISAIGGKLLVGYLADKIDLRLVFAYVAGSNALLVSIYILQPSFWMLMLAVALLGIAVGGVFPAWSTIMAWLFGARSYGTVMGMMAIIMQPFAVITMRFIGEVYDRTGSYVPAFSLFVVLALTAIGLISLLRPEPRGMEDDTSAGSQPTMPASRDSLSS